MNSPRQREFHDHDNEHEQSYAPGPVIRKKRSWLRRNWLTGAFICTLGVAAAATVLNFYETEVKLQHARAESATYQARLDAAQRKSRDLADQLKQISSDEHMEMMARSNGYVMPNETVYHKGSSPGN